MPPEPKREILIGTPTADGIVTTGYAESLLAAARAISRAGHLHRYVTLDFFDVAVARNHILHMALAVPEISHVLFIDNDMCIAQSVFEALIAADKPMIGGIYTRRKIDLEAYAAARAEGHAPEVARALASPFILRLIGRSRLTVEKGLAEVDGVGFGAALVSTTLLRQMAASGEIPQTAGLEAAGLKPGTQIWDFCAPVTAANGEPLSEDFSFCARANAAVPKAVWGLACPGIEHIGQFSYGADFGDRLRAMNKAARAQAEAGKP
ncbi:MAG: hypothetical protein AAGC57_07295 [Pseudomonadota bacterium]